jgi:imidazolonepropionase-like amidohydrolase
MASRDVVLVPTLSTFHDLAERFADEFAPSLVDQAKRQLDEAYQTVGAARRAGVTIAVGYDSGPPGASAQEILRLSEAGLTPFEAIAAATAGGATALGRTDLGSLVPGACADLLVVNGRPDEDLRLLASPDSFEFVMKDGAIVE